jgi:hypothetical protein
VKSEQGIQREYKKPFSDPADASDYDYRIDRRAEPVLVIKDLNKGGKSVTNNMEAILKRIAADEGCILAMPIIYRDSEGNYDGVTPSSNPLGSVSFYSLSTTDEHFAIQKALEMSKATL